MTMQPDCHATLGDPRRIVVVGPCAAGKSTLVAALQAQGYDARVCGQEHSDIPTLWRRSRPDVLVALSVDLASVRARRDSAWPEWLHDRQLERLRNACETADVRIDTTGVSPKTVVEHAIAYLRRSST